MFLLLCTRHSCKGNKARRERTTLSNKDIRANRKWKNCFRHWLCGRRIFFWCSGHFSGKLRQGPSFVLAGLRKPSETERVLGTSSKPKQYETKWRPKAASGLANDIYGLANFMYFFGMMYSLLLISCVYRRSSSGKTKMASVNKGKHCFITWSF